MKNSIIKFRHSIIALIMIVLNGVGAFASAPWTVNPSDYRYDMSLYLDVTFAAAKMDYSKYEVAVFCGDQCRGIAEALPLGNGNECLYLRARSNQEAGETMTFKYYNKETEEIQPIDGISFKFESNGRLGYPSDPYIVRIIRHFDVTLSAGTGGSINQESGRVVEGTELIITATPSEGYHFEQWSDGNTDNPRTVTVDADINLAAEFGVNTYNLVYNVDGNLYKEYEINYGTAITAEAYPEKVGHTFSGWEGLPETMPAHDVTVSGTFSINSYNAVFKIGEDVIETKSVVFGEPVVAPEAPAKEGHTFVGWQNVPETMPAHDVEILGSYTVNQYKLTYMVEGVNYKEYTVDYGTAITAEAYPEKEGHTFSGWDGLPETMPAHDITVNGYFTVNKYKLTIYLNDVFYSSEDVEFGTILKIEEPTVPDGYQFDGWTTEIPETMPAYDLDIYGTYTSTSSIANIQIDDNERVVIYTLSGFVIYKNVLWHEVQSKLENGLYIINGTKYLIRR